MYCPALADLGMGEMGNRAASCEGLKGSSRKKKKKKGGGGGFTGFYRFCVRLINDIISPCGSVNLVGTWSVHQLLSLRNMRRRGGVWFTST